MEYATQLNLLVLRENQISDITPLAGLTSLSKLRLQKNQISDITPLKNLTSLTELLLKDNEISDVTPLTGLVNLVKLELAENPITDASVLSGLVNLTNVDIEIPEPDSQENETDNSENNDEGTSGNNEGGTSGNNGNDNSGDNEEGNSPENGNTNPPPPPVPDPSTWMPDANLRTAVRESLELTDADTLTQAKMVDLTELKAAGRSINDITGVEHATNLTTARFAHNQISDVSSLSGLTNLRTLRLQDNSIADISSLSGLTGLTQLFIEDNQISDITPLAGLVNLVKLKVAGNPFENAGANAETLDTLRAVGVEIDLSALGGNAPVLGDETSVPAETLLLSNYPNPFNPETWIPYQLANPADVTLTIYAVNGRVVQRLALGHQPAGMYHNRSRAAYWDGKNEFGESVASGIYFYQLQAGHLSLLRKMLLLK